MGRKQWAWHCPSFAQHRLKGNFKPGKLRTPPRYLSQPRPGMAEVSPGLCLRPLQPTNLSWATFRSLGWRCLATSPSPCSPAVKCADVHVGERTTAGGRQGSSGTRGLSALPRTSRARAGCPRNSRGSVAMEDAGWGASSRVQTRVGEGDCFTPGRGRGRNCNKRPGGLLLLHSLYFRTSKNFNVGGRRTRTKKSREPRPKSAMNV